MTDNDIQQRKRALRPQFSLQHRPNLAVINPVRSLARNNQIQALVFYKREILSAVLPIGNIGLLGRCGGLFYH
jgi:hypothetical protein